MYYAPLDVYFSETDVYQPDILFIHQKQAKIIGKSKIEGNPDIVIEILSPATAYYDLRKKFRIYEKFGVCAKNTGLLIRNCKELKFMKTSILCIRFSARQKMREMFHLQF